MIPLRVAMASLTDRERDIIRLRYGEDGGFTLESAGMVFKITRERVRQIEQDALRKLQGTVLDLKTCPPALREKLTERTY